MNVKLFSDEKENGHIEYCVHFEHRTPEYDEDELNQLISFVNNLQLNEFDRELHLENQKNCW